MRQEVGQQLRILGHQVKLHLLTRIDRRLPVERIARGDHRGQRGKVRNVVDLYRGRRVVATVSTNDHGNVSVDRSNFLVAAVGADFHAGSEGTSRRRIEGHGSRLLVEAHGIPSVGEGVVV